MMKQWYLAFIKRFKEEGGFRYLYLGGGIVGIIAEFGIIGVLLLTFFLALSRLISLFLYEEEKRYIRAMLKKWQQAFLVFFSRKKDQTIERSSIKKHSILKSFLPANKTEEVIGDLAEMKAMLKEEGYSKFQIWRILTFNKLVIIFSFQWKRVLEWFTEQTQINK